MKNKVVLLSGANRGIGFAIAKKLYDAGYLISLGVRNPSEMDSFIGDHDNSRILSQPIDLLDKVAMDNWINSTIEKFESIDIVINCAGILKKTSIENYDETVIDEIFAINVKAPIYLVSKAWNYLKKSKEGRVINVCSLSAKRVKGGSYAYGMSKSALLSFTHSIRHAGWNEGIRATAICPGWVNTKMIREICPFNLDEITQPEDVAQLILDVIQLPNRVSVPELAFNCQLEDLF